MAIKTNRKTVTAYIILSLVFVSIVTPVLQNAHLQIEKRLEELEVSIFREAEEWLGFSIEYSSVSPSLLGHLEIRNLRIFDEESKESLLVVGRLNIYYSFISFFRGDPLSAIDRISIENTRITYDPDRKLEPLFMDKIRGRNNSLDDFPRISINGRNITLSLNVDGNRVKVEKLFFTLNPEENGWRLSLKGRGELNSVETNSTPGMLSGRFTVNSFIANSFNQAESSLTIRNLDSDYLSARSISFLINWKDSIIGIRKVQDRVPYDLFLNMNMESRKIELELSTENFIPVNYFQLNSGFYNLAPVFNTSYTGDIHGSYNLSTGEIYYKSSLNVRIPINEYIPVPLIAEIHAEGDLEKIKFERVEIQSRQGDLFFIGNIDLQNSIPLPSGALKVTNAMFQDHFLSGMLYLDRQSRYYSVQAPWILFDGLPFEDTSIRLMGDLDNVDIFLETTLSDTGLDNTLFAEGNFIMGEEPFFQILVESFNFPVGKAGIKLIPDLDEELEKQIEPVVLNAQGYLSSNLEKFSFNASRFELINTINPDEFLSLSVSGNNSGLSFRNLNLQYADMELSGDGTTNWENENELRFITNLVFQEIPYSFEGIYDPEISLHLKGDYGLEGTVYFQTDTSFFSLETLEFPIPFRGEEFKVDLNARGDYTSLENWHILVKSGGLRNLPMDNEGVRTSEVNFSGTFSPGGGRLYNLDYLDDFSPLEGNGEIYYSLDRRYPEVGGWLQLYNPLSSESYSVGMEYFDGIISGTVNVDAMPMERFGEIPLSGNISGMMEVDGPVISPNIIFYADLEEGKLNDVPINFSTRITLLDEILNIETMELSYLNYRGDINSGSYSFFDGNAEVSGDFSGFIQENPISGNFNISAELEPLSAKLDFVTLKESEIYAKLSVENIMIFDQEHNPWDLDFKYIKGRTSFEGGPQNSLEGFYDPVEGFDIAVMKPMPMNFRARGKLEGGNIDAELTEISMDFQTIEKYFKIPGFTLMSGEALGTLKVMGPLTDPDLFGSLDVSNLTAMLSIMKNPLTLNKTTIKADRKTLKIDNIIVNAEKGSAIMNCEFILDHLAPYSYSIYLETIYNRDPYLDFIFPGIIMEGFVNGGILINGDLNEFRLTGDIEVSSGHVTLDPDIVAEAKSAVDVIIDMSIVLGNNNTFYWPSRNLPLLKAYAESGEKLIFIMNSARNTFDFKGNVVVKGGEIFYFRRNFYLQEGILVFNENQDRFNPILDAKAVIREVDKNGELVRIFLIADANPLLDFEPRFESDPYLTNQEIVTMLGANLFNTQESDVLLSEAILLTSDVLSQFGFFQSLQESVKTNLGLDVFSLRSQIVPNLITERFLPGEEGIGDTSFARYLDNTTLFIGKYLGRDFFLQGVMQMDYYDANSVDDLYFSPEFNIDTEVTLEWKSPVALIELSLYPDFFDQSDALLTTSLSLSWSFSF